MVVLATYLSISLEGTGELLGVNGTIVSYMGPTKTSDAAIFVQHKLHSVLLGQVSEFFTIRHFV